MAKTVKIGPEIPQGIEEQQAGESAFAKLKAAKAALASAGETPLNATMQPEATNLASAGETPLNATMQPEATKTVTTESVDGLKVRTRTGVSVVTNESSEERAQRAKTVVESDTNGLKVRTY